MSNFLTQIRDRILGSRALLFSLVICLSSFSEYAWAQKAAAAKDGGDIQFNRDDINNLILQDQLAAQDLRVQELQAAVSEIQRQIDALYDQLEIQNCAEQAINYQFEIDSPEWLAAVRDVCGKFFQFGDAANLDRLQSDLRHIQNVLQKAYDRQADLEDQLFN